jgi:hypothetical protein
MTWVIEYTQYWHSVGVVETVHDESKNDATRTVGFRCVGDAFNFSGME